MATLADYYSGYFPFEHLFSFLNLNCSEPSQNREYSLTLVNDIYVRYKSYQSSAELRNEISKSAPIKIDVGAVYNYNPSLKKSHHNVGELVDFSPQFRELVFDIDISDYDDVRSCCKEKEICQKCWKLLGFSMRYIDFVLREFFGASNLIWFFSGRRGVHCWVCEPQLGYLDQTARKAIISLLQLTENELKLFPRLLAFIESSAFDCLSDFLMTQNIDFVQLKLIELISDKEILDPIISAISSPDGEPKKVFKRVADFLISLCKSSNASHKTICLGIVKKFLFPRIDTNVSIQPTHLIKAPFCVHPATNKICVPIDIDKLNEFSIDSVPGLDSISENPDALNESIKYFKSFIEMCSRK